MLNPQQQKQFEEFSREVHDLIEKYSNKKVEFPILIGTLMTQCKVLSCLVHPTYEETKQSLERMIDKDLKEMHQEYTQLKMMVGNSQPQGEK